MKKLLIVNIPDESFVHDKDLEDFISERIQEWYNLYATAEIVTLPTEEEIAKRYPLLSEMTPEQRIGQLHSRDGINWYRNEILKQLK